MRGSSWADRIGWFIEKGFIWLFCSLFVIIFLGNKLLLLINNNYGFLSLEKSLYHGYDVIIEPNIGTITTIASIFVGIYITVLSVLGSIKANSVIALLSDANLKLIIKFIITGLIASFIVVFYSFFAVIIPFQFIKSFVFFLLIIYMLLTSLRLGINLSIIYSVDLNKLSENLEKEKEDAERHARIMLRLERYLDDREAERLRRRP
jgi:hypothetical protein